MCSVGLLSRTVLPQTIFNAFPNLSIPLPLGFLVPFLFLPCTPSYPTWPFRSFSTQQSTTPIAQTAINSSIQNSSFTSWHSPTCVACAETTDATHLLSLQFYYLICLYQTLSTHLSITKIPTPPVPASLPVHKNLCLLVLLVIILAELCLHLYFLCTALQQTSAFLLLRVSTIFLGFHIWSQHFSLWF